MIVRFLRTAPLPSSSSPPLILSFPDLQFMLKITFLGFQQFDLHMASRVPLSPSCLSSGQIPDRGFWGRQDMIYPEPDSRQCAAVLRPSAED